MAKQNMLYINKKEIGEIMSEIKSWLSNNYTANNYDSDVDPDIAVARRRKAVEELRGLLRQKCLQKIDIAIKRE